MDNLIKKFKINISYKNIYLNDREIKLMRDMGMIIASHGHTHRLLSNLNYESQKVEILSSIEFLEKKI